MATYWWSLTDAVEPAWWEPLMRFATLAAGLGLPVLHVYRHLHT